METGFIFWIWVIIIIVCLLFLIQGIKRRKWFRMIMSGFIMVLFVMMILNFIYRSYMASSPDWIYKQAFGITPDNSVNIINAKYEFGADFTVIFLKYEITDVNNVNILNGDISEISVSDYKDEILFIESPKWFKPLDDPQTKYFQNEPFSSPRVFVSLSEKNNLIYYYSSKSD